MVNSYDQKQKLISVCVWGGGEVIDEVLGKNN